MRKIWICVLLFAFAVTSCNKKGSGSKGDKSTSSVVTYGIKFRAGSFERILEKAKEENKPIFLDFYTSWCMPCKWLEEDVFSHRNVYEYYNDNIISLKIDAEKGEGPDLALKYNVVGYPTLVYLDRNGNVLDSHAGMTTISNVVVMGERAVQENSLSGDSGSME